MKTATRNEPIYVFRLTADRAMRWTSFSLLLFLLTVAGISIFYETIHGQSWALRGTIQRDRMWETFLVILSAIAIPVGTFIVHELVHGLAFAAFGGKPRYGIGSKFFFPYAYTTSPGDCFSRDRFLAIALAPLIVIDIVCLLLLAIFPQATWLGWVVAINTAGASGDIWIATLLRRCPPSISVEDRKEGVAIYAPPGIDTDALPFPTATLKQGSKLWMWFNGTLAVLVLLILVVLFLPPLLYILQVPSFSIGTETLSILRWQNDARGTGIAFNPLLMVAIAAGMGLLVVLLRTVQRDRKR